MLSLFIENLLRGLSAATITEIFAWLLLAIFLLALVCKKKSWLPAFTQYTPTLLTSLGILGTFTGIIVGLLDFDTTHIETSIGPLLDGLKTAFITSLLGMLASIVFKGLVTTGLFHKPDEYGVTEDEVGALELYEVMKQQAEGIQQLKKAISDSDESSLVGQFKLLRSDLSDNHKVVDRHLLGANQTVVGQFELLQAHKQDFNTFQESLWKRLEDFAEMMSKSATEQVIEALNQVIKDFNQQLTEQFGENFKKLNEAVFELVQWQENYRQQLAEMKTQYDLGVAAITQSEAAVTTISNEARVIPDTMTNLKTVMEVNQHQIDELNRHLEAFKDIRDRAVMAVPEIQDQIDQALEGAKSANDQLAKGILESAEKIQTVVGQSADQYKDAVDRTRESLNLSAQETVSATERIRQDYSDVITDINNNMRNLIQELLDGGKALKDDYQKASRSLIDETSQLSRAFNTSVNEIKDTLANTISEQATEHRKRADQVFAGLQKSIEQSLADTGEAVEKKVAMIDQTMGQEIEKVMQSMGAALATISGQFTNDYGKLVRQMKAIAGGDR